ncbi:MAG: NADH-quinone oxidoreductase subunit NuoG [bacterium]
MPTLIIDEKTLEVPAGVTVLQACELAGVEIPRFCYHDRLKIAGNCRMCLVDLEKAPKPIASCAMPVAEGMVVHTNNDRVQKARRGAMEFLLINHPLDCPICDQGGECDLQDQAMAYGMDKSRYHEEKRAVSEKDMGPLIKTVMTRCIHCTRCVRFAEDIAGVPALGAVGRGESMEITTLGRPVASELSGNIVDLCPVGALTSKPYAFHARPWDLDKTESIDVLDAVGSNIRIDVRGSEVVRILPRLHEDINEEWISDKARHACDGLKYQRLDRPYIRHQGDLKEASWDQALRAAAQRFHQPETLAALGGPLADLESLFVLKTLLDASGVTRYDGAGGGVFPLDVRSRYILNTTIAGLESVDALLLVGTNPRWEAPLINARIRKRYLQNGLPVGVVGEAVDLTYPYHHLGTTPDALVALAKGLGDFGAILKKAQRPALILGASVLARPDGEAIYAYAADLAEQRGMITPDFVGFNVLHHNVGTLAALDLGFVTQGGQQALFDAVRAGAVTTLYLYGADDVPTDVLEKAFVIYQGHHGDKAAHYADVILPGAAYTEKQALYVNTEGRIQEALPAVTPPHLAKEDWKIVRALADHVSGVSLTYRTLEEVRLSMVNHYPALAVRDHCSTASWPRFPQSPKTLDKAPLVSPVTNFYQTDPISRASKTMAECTRVFVHGAQNPDDKKAVA